MSARRLFEVAEPFPLVCTRLKMCAVRLALRREFVRVARRRLEDAHTSGGDTTQHQRAAASRLSLRRSSLNVGTPISPAPNARLSRRGGEILAEPHKPTGPPASPSSSGPTVSPTSHRKDAQPWSSNLQFSSDKMGPRIEVMERRIESIDAKLDALQHLSGVEEKLEALQAQMQRLVDVVSRATSSPTSSSAC